LVASFPGHRRNDSTAKEWGYVSGGECLECTKLGVNWRGLVVSGIVVQTRGLGHSCQGALRTPWWTCRVRSHDPTYPFTFTQKKINKQKKIGSWLWWSNFTLTEHKHANTHSPIFSSLPYLPLYSIIPPFHSDAYLHKCGYTNRIDTFFGVVTYRRISFLWLHVIFTWLIYEYHVWLAAFNWLHASSVTLLPTWPTVMVHVVTSWN